MYFLSYLNCKHADTLQNVEVLAENSFQCVGDHTQTHEWKGYGLKLHVSKGSTASFIARVVHSTKFVLPEETELVSPIYWVTSIGETLGPVKVEIQHCIDIKKDAELSGLGSAICRVEKSEQSYRFSMANACFSHESSFGEIELVFSGWFVGLIKWLVGWEVRFTARLYYYDMISTNEFKVGIVIVPDDDTCLVGLLVSIIIHLYYVFYYRN